MGTVPTVKFGLFFLCERPPWQSQAAAYHDALDQAVYADALGFDAVWIAEHHFSEYGIVPDAAVLAAALAQRVRRMRIGTGVSILPFTNPIRAAESLAMVDQLSGGRLDFGVGRGHHPGEFAGFGVPRDESRERFDESLEIIRRAWTEETFTYEGRFYQARNITVMPKPVQKPHPPIWVAAVSPESFERAARSGYRVLSAPAITPPALLAKGYETYRRVWSEAGHAADPEIPALHFTYVGASDPQARREPEACVMWHLRRQYPPHVDYAHCYESVLLFGDIERVVERIARLRDELGVTYLLAWMNFGGLESDLARNSLRRFAEKIIPRFR